MQKNSGHDSINTWLGIWRSTSFQELPIWDDQCELVYSLLTSFLKSDLTGKTILETGSGTGRVSLRLAKEGANVVLLDVSRDALNSSKRIFKNCLLSGDYVLADLSNLPFQDCGLDVVWSSGVLEHFSQTELDTIIDKLLAIIKKDGTLVAIVPNKHALVYDFSRQLDMKTGNWQWGYEEPLSAKDLLHLHVKPLMTRSTGFVYQLNFLSLPIVGRVWRKLRPYFYPKLKTLDRYLPGYLVAGAWQK
jgi:ubiquinone/menaquinone biosynthesis C-methylase UbiE